MPMALHDKNGIKNHKFNILTPNHFQKLTPLVVIVYTFRKTYSRYIPTRSYLMGPPTVWIHPAMDAVLAFLGQQPFPDAEVNDDCDDEKG